MPSILDRHYAAGEMASIARIAHGLVSAAGLAGHPDLAAAARTVEGAVRADGDVIPMADFVRLRDRLARVVAGRPEAAPST